MKLLFFPSSFLYLFDFFDLAVKKFFQSPAVSRKIKINADALQNSPLDISPGLWYTNVMKLLGSLYSKNLPPPPPDIV
jgi:hypothetical protein